MTVDPQPAQHAPVRRRGSDGQILPFFAILLVVILGFMGLGIDAAQTFLERRDAQGAADLAALAGARFLPGDRDQAISQATAVAVSNGFRAEDVYPLTPYKGDASKIQVIIDSQSKMFFMPVLGIDALDVRAEAVAQAAGSAASCSFCSLNGSTKNHTLLLKNGATLRVDGDIIVNSVNGGVGPECEIKDWEVCGDGFDIFGDPAEPPAYISAKSISVAGGWETHDENIVMSDGKVWPDYSTNPPTYKTCPSISPNPNLQPASQPANVCIHVPKIVDPLNDPRFPQAMVPGPSLSDFRVPTADTCAGGTRFPPNDKRAAGLVIASDATICPGVYYGGIKITAGTTTMLPGFYFMAGRNGFTVSGSGSVDGTSGVTIFSGTESSGSNIHIVPNPDLNKPLDPNRLDPEVSISSSRNPVKVGDSVRFEFKVKPLKDGPRLNGSVDFFDGDTRISGVTKCETASISGATREQKVTCEVTYTSKDMGTHGITAVFFSDDTCSSEACYNNAIAVLEPVQTVEGGGDVAGDIELETTGNVQLKGSRSGPYKGIVLYMDRSSDGAIQLSYGSGLAECTPAVPWTVDGVWGPKWALQQPPGPACGALGGLEGTIYAAHEDSLVTTTVSGLGNIQVIAGKMLITSLATTRFAFDSDLFAGNTISLVE